MSGGKQNHLVLLIAFKRAEDCLLCAESALTRFQTFCMFVVVSTEDTFVLETHCIRSEFSLNLFSSFTCTT
eukprot:m.107058 g.107058  ORF g.107058 m.107058 type:complete len:71 (+) comp15172_c0_seq2:1058-1270(+)